MSGAEFLRRVLRRGRSVRSLVLPVAVLGMLLIVAFAPLSALDATGLPQAPTDAKYLTAAQIASRTSVRKTHFAPLDSLPLGAQPNLSVHNPTDLLPLERDALGRLGAEQLDDLLTGQVPLKIRYLNNTLRGAQRGPKVPYPYQYPPMDKILDRAPAAGLARSGLALGAALIELAGQPRGAYISLSNAAPAAYAILDRVRNTGGCAAQIDLLLLLAGDSLTKGQILQSETKRTEQACPGDPTPSWLVGEATLGLATDDWATAVPVIAYPSDRRTLASAIADFRRLVGNSPASPVAHSGLGDAYLRSGVDLAKAEPFTARYDDRQALDQYSLAIALGAGRAGVIGYARALIALGDPDRAARLLAPLIRSSSAPGPLLELQILALENGHHFAAAERVGQRLTANGTPSYPRPNAFYPVPRRPYFSVGTLGDPSAPESYGAETLAPLTDSLYPAGGANATVTDASFIPLSRNDPGVTGTDTACPAWSWRRDALLAGDATTAVQRWDGSFHGVRPRNESVICPLDGPLHALLVAKVRAEKDGKPMSGSYADQWQNLLRWAGQLSAARRSVVAWARHNPTDYRALRDLGEIDFLTQRYNAAAGEFDTAQRLARLAHYNNDVIAFRLALDRGAAMLAAGRTAEAEQVLRPLDDHGTQGYAYQNSQYSTDNALSFAADSYYSCEQLADREREAGQLHAAVDDYRCALSWIPKLSEANIRSDVIYNNAAIAYLGLGRARIAQTLERKALAVDPENPAFRMTQAFADERAGHRAEAIAENRAVLAADPTTYPAANDLGVELAADGKYSAAVAALRQAIGARPGYALAWFNLGVVESRRGLAGVFAGQGALARAYRLDPKLADRRLALTIDGSTYRTSLDLSKPLPAAWSFARSQRAVPIAAAGVLAVALLGLGLARQTRTSAGEVTQAVLDRMDARLARTRLAGLANHPAWAAGTTVLVFGLATFRHPLPVWTLVSYLAGIALLVLIAHAARIAVARRVGSTCQQRSWLPSMIVGLVAAGFGLPLAPLPVLDGERIDRRVHLAAPLILALLAVVLFVEAAWLHTPLTRDLAIAALVMAGSLLVPVKPLDGAALGTAGGLAGCGVVAGAVLVVTGLL